MGCGCKERQGIGDKLENRWGWLSGATRVTVLPKSSAASSMGLSKAGPDLMCICSNVFCKVQDVLQTLRDLLCWQHVGLVQFQQQQACLPLCGAVTPSSKIEKRGTFLICLAEQFALSSMYTLGDTFLFSTSSSTCWHITRKHV